LTWVIDFIILLKLNQLDKEVYDKT
jgi:hypothetical protein